MSSTIHLANRFREVMLTGHWVANTNLREQLNLTDWKIATAKIGEHNSIAALTFHLHYYIAGVLEVLRGGPLEIRDKYSFDAPAPESQKDWEERLSVLWNDSEAFATLVEQLPESRLNQPFVDPKYGDYQKNIDGMIEHCYYHLGQIVLIRKLVQ